MENKALGRLEEVSLREFWKTESADFTPWLAQDENIYLLSETIGVELEVEAQEKDVGPFRADILCKDTVSGNWVLIENQLEKTDHIHLGQLLTYAAGLNAVTIVWVADKFTDEHRATLDWLNEITDERFNFFGLEIELWKIGNSPLAPKFNVVSKPNDWSRSVSGATSRIEKEALTDAKKMQLEYWTSFREHVQANSQYLRPQKPLPQHWTNFAIGRSDFWMSASVNTQQNKITTQVNFGGPDAKAHFNLLLQNKENFESDFGGSLDWRELPDRKESKIVIEKHIDPFDTNSWPEQHRWLLENLEKLHSIFSDPIKRLNADDFIND